MRKYRILFSVLFFEEPNGWLFFVAKVARFLMATDKNNKTGQAVNRVRPPRQRR